MLGRVLGEASLHLAVHAVAERVDHLHGEVGHFLQQRGPRPLRVAVDRQDPRDAVLSDRDRRDRIELDRAACRHAAALAAGGLAARAALGAADAEGDLETVDGDDHRLSGLLRRADDGLALRDAVDAVEEVVDDVVDLLAHGGLQARASTGAAGGGGRRRTFLTR